MVNHQQIGLIAWGLKLGKDVFFSLGGVSAKEAEIVQTMEDARGIINMPHSGETFYSVEFTEQYKVYTVFYTVMDWSNRDNAYLAISLLVPYHLFFKNKVLTVLQALLDIYKQYYIDPGQRIARQQERTDLFEKKLGEFPLEDLGWAMKRPNTSKDTNYAHIRYVNDQQLDEFLENPCLKSFASYKEIYFLPVGNDKLSAVHAIGAPLQVQPEPLFRTARLVLQDGEGHPLMPPCMCTINGETFIDMPSIEHKIKDHHLQTLKVTAQKDGYRTFDRSLNMAADFREGLYTARLEKRLPLSVKFVYGEDFSPLEGVKVRVQKSGSPQIESKQSDAKGEVNFDKFYADESFDLTASKDGFEPIRARKINPTGTPPVLIPMKKPAPTPPPNKPNKGASASHTNQTGGGPTSRNDSHTGGNTTEGAQTSINTGETPRLGLLGFLLGMFGSTKKAQTGTTSPTTDNQQNNAVQGDSRRATHPKLINSLRIVGFAILGLSLLTVMVFGGHTMWKQSQENKKLNATKDELRKMLQNTYTPIKKSYFDLREQALALGTMTTEKLKESAKNLKEQISLKEKEFGRDTTKLAGAIDILEHDSLKIETLKSRIGSTLKEHEAKSDTLKVKVERLRGQITQEQEVAKQSAATNAKNATRRAELKRLAETMCDRRAENARKYAKEVKANTIGFTPAEINKLVRKFDLIHNILSHEYKGRKSAQTITEQEDAKDALKAIQSQHEDELSPAQLTWLVSAINAKWKIPE